MQQEKKANESRYFFVCGTEKFHVDRFSVTDEVSALYEVTLDLSSPNPDVALDDITGKQATFFMYRDGQHYPYSGIVRDFRYCGSRPSGRSAYSATLKPRLSKLDLWRQTRIFQKLSYPEIISETLEQAGLRGYCTMELSREYPVKDYVVQYQESDFSFISRLMESAGLWYFFREPPIADSQPKAGATSETLVITDKPASFKAIDDNPRLPFRDAGGMVECDETQALESVSAVGSRRTATPREVLVKNYNYRTPDVRIEGSLELKNGFDGMVYEYGGNFRNITEARDAAKVAANRIEAWRTVIDGSSTCLRFRAGRRFSLAEHPRAGLNDDYVLVKVTHTGSHGDGSPTYVNTFDALPAAAANAFAPIKKTDIPRIDGVMTAMVEAGGGMYASIDEMARYKARMPFDTSGAGHGEASKYLRLMQPYAGAKCGMHFPAREGAEMVWACIDGDPDKPIALGMVPNADTPSPVVSANKAQNIIRTAGGNELLMDDTDKKQKIRLITPTKNVFEADDDLRRAFIQTAAENRVVLDDKNERVTVAAGKHSVTMSYKSGEEGVVISTAGGHVVNIDDKNKRITIQTNAGSAIQMDDGAKSIVMKDAGEKNSVTLDGKGLVLDSQGKIQITARQGVEIRGAAVAVSSESGDVSVKAKNNAVVSGMKINVKARADAVIEGMNTTLKAQMQNKVEGGMGVTVNSNMQTKVAGAMAELSGSGMTTVKGGVVMIN